jgi:hypothetical protein
VESSAQKLLQKELSCQRTQLLIGPLAEQQGKPGRRRDNGAGGQIGLTRRGTFDGQGKFCLGTDEGMRRTSNINGIKKCSEKYIKAREVEQLTAPTRISGWSTCFKQNSEAISSVSIKRTKKNRL